MGSLSIKVVELGALSFGVLLALGCPDITWTYAFFVLQSSLLYEYSYLSTWAAHHSRTI